MKHILLWMMICGACSLQAGPFLVKVVDGKYIPVAPNQLPAYRVGASDVNIPITGFTIANPGKYIVNSAQTTAFNVNVTPITITASDVELDLNGFTITGPGKAAGTDAGITVTGVSNVVIKNGTIELINGDGIALFDCTSVRLEDILCRQNGDDGFSVSTVSNEHCSIINCRAEGNGDVGFFDAGGASISYKDCTAYNNGAAGMDLTANNHLVQNCSSSENTGSGLVITGISVDVLDSHFDDNVLAGLDAESVTDFCIARCTMNRNTLLGVDLDGAVNGSLVRSCIMGNGSHGIGVAGIPRNSSSISICENVVIGNTGIGITLDATTTQSCQIIDNKVVRNAPLLSTAAGISIGSGTVFAAGALGASPTSHEVFSNYAKNNGTNPADINAAGNDTNYSNDVQASPNGVPAAPNGLVTTPAAGAGRLQNITT